MATFSLSKLKKDHGDVQMTISPEIQQQADQIKSAVDSHAAANPSYMGRLTDNVGADINNRVNNVDEILKRPDTGAVEKGLQIFGQGAGLAANTAEQTVLQVPGVKQAAEGVGQGINWLATSNWSPIKHLGDLIGSNKSVQDVVHLYDTDPNFKSTVDAVGNIARLSGDVQAGVSGGTAAVEGATNVIPKLATKVSSGVSSVVDSVSGATSKATNSMSGLGTKVTDALNPIAKNVETVLKETPKAKLDSYVNIAKQATLDSKAMTPLEVAGSKATEALGHIQKDLTSTGELKSTILNQTGIGRQPVGNIVNDFIQNVQDTFSGKTLVGGDEKMIADLTAKAKALGPNPLARDVDAFIDYAQDRIYTGGKNLTVPVTDEVTGGLRSNVGELNGKLKGQLPDAYKRLNSRYSDLVQTRNELNTKLGAQGERAGSLMKRVFSPSDANTKALFEKVYQETGIDLVNEAVLAKYVMETMGDARQASLLEQALGRGPAITTKSGIIGELYQKAKSLVQNPEQNIKKAQRMTVGGTTDATVAKPKLPKSNLSNPAVGETANTMPIESLKYPYSGTETKAIGQLDSFVQQAVKDGAISLEDATGADMSLVKFLKENYINKGLPVPPLEVKPDGTILDGVHHFDAYKILGLKNIPVIVKKK